MLGRPRPVRTGDTVGVADPLAGEKPFLDPELEAKHLARIERVRAAQETLSKAAAALTAAQRLPDRDAGGADEAQWQHALAARDVAAVQVRMALAALTSREVELDRRRDRELAMERLASIAARRERIGELVTEDLERAVVVAVKSLGPIYGLCVRRAVAHAELDQEEGVLRKHLGEKEFAKDEVVAERYANIGRDRFTNAMQKLKNLWNAAVREVDTSAHGHASDTRGVTRLVSTLNPETEITVVAQARARELLDQLGESVVTAEITRSRP